MSRWWRAYDEAADDPKLQRLPAELFRAWFNLVCLASRNGGVLPSLPDIAFRLRKSEREAKRAIDALIAAELFDVSETGTGPHNWNARQYQSDVSTNRVRAFRQRQRKRFSETDETVSGNGPESEQNRVRADIGDPPDGGPPDSEFQKSSPVAAREDGPAGADAHDTASVLARLGSKLKASQDANEFPHFHERART